MRVGEMSIKYPKRKWNRTESVIYIHRSKFAIMQVCHLSKFVICENFAFLHSLDVLLKMFANSLLVVN